MIDVFELYEELCGSVNTQQGGHVRPNRNFLQWINSIQLSLFEEKFAAWSKSQKIIDDMSKPFLKSVNVAVNALDGNEGLAEFPDDYAHYSSACYYQIAGTDTVRARSDLDMYDCCGKKIEADDDCPVYVDTALWEAMQSEKKATAPKTGPALKKVPIGMVSNDRWGSVCGRRMGGPSMAKPRMTQFEKGFRVAPAGVTVIVLDYLRIPRPATFEYTVVAPDELTGHGGYLVYDKDKSLPLEWSTLIKNEFLVRLDKKYGKYIREDFIWQTAESDRKQTV